MERVRRIMQELVSAPGTNNEPDLAINQLRQMVARNKGFPCHLYHPVLDPVVVINSAQKKALMAQGYVENYIHKDYPRMLFKRNMDPKFEVEEFIEKRVVKDAVAEKTLLAQGWANSPADCEPLAPEAEEDPKVTIARLQERLTALTEQMETQPKRR